MPGMNERGLLNGLEIDLSPPDDGPSWIVRMIFPAIAVIVAAICVWLTIRIINRRERWAKRTLVLLLALTLVLPACYGLSTGPVLWLASREYLPEWLWDLYSLPADWISPFIPDSMRHAWTRYNGWWWALGT
jgi:hypothetical protein